MEKTDEQNAQPKPVEPQAVANWLKDLDEDARESFLHAMEKND